MGYLSLAATNSPKLFLQARVFISPKTERKINSYHHTLKAKAFEKGCESQKERKLVHGEGTVRCALLTEGQPNEKKTAFRTVTHACMQHNLAKLWRGADGTEHTDYAQNNIRTEEGKCTQYIQCFLSCMMAANTKNH